MFGKVVLSDGVLWSFITVTVAILLDVILGVVKSVMAEGEGFDLRLLPKFLATGILPYVGGMGVLALAAEFVGEPFTAVFYAASAATLAKYLVEVKDKVGCIFDIEIGGRGGTDND